MLCCILQEAQLLGQAAPCTHILHILDPATLIPLLSKTFINNTEAAYGSRHAALHLLTALISCVRNTWECANSRVAGSEWDGAVVQCLSSVVRYVCMPNHDTRLGGFKGKQLLRQALACLLELVHAVPVVLWSEAWQQVGSQPPACRLTCSRLRTCVASWHCSSRITYAVGLPLLLLLLLHQIWVCPPLPCRLFVTCHYAMIRCTMRQKPLHRMGCARCSCMPQLRDDVRRLHCNLACGQYESVLYFLPILAQTKSKVF